MFLVEDFRAGRGVVGRLTQVRLPRKALLFSSAGAIGLLAFAAPALADQSYCMTSGDVSVLSCHTAKVDVRATTGETSLTVEGLTIDGEDSINFTTANGATGPLTMELIVNDTSVNTAIYGGVNVYSGLANTDIDVTLGEDVTLMRARIGASYNWYDVKGTRDVTFPGVSEDLSGNYDSKSWSAFGEVSYGLALGKTLVEPFAGINHVNLKTDGFGETGGMTALAVSKVTREVTYSTLGLRLGTALPVSDAAVITPRISAAWLHGFGDVKAAGRNSLSTGESFSIEGLPTVRNSVRLEAGAQANILPGGSLGISYVGNLSDQWRDHGLKLGFSYSF